MVCTKMEVFRKRSFENAAKARLPTRTFKQHLRRRTSIRTTRRREFVHSITLKTFRYQRVGWVIHNCEGHGMLAVMRPNTRYARSGELNIAYQVIGDGPLDIIYVPGFGSNLDYTWPFPCMVHVFERCSAFTDRRILFFTRP
jgi:hypothetical protein